MGKDSDKFSVEVREITKVCPECGQGLEGTFLLNGEIRRIVLTCECTMPEEKTTDYFEAAQKRAFGRRVPNGSFDLDDGMNMTVTNECSSYASSFKSIMPCKVNGLILFGNARQGKTFMAEAITNQIIKDGNSALFITAVEIVQLFQYGTKQEVKDFLSKVESVDLLVIDDFGAQRDTGFAYEAVFSVIDTRYSARKPILITTNATAEEMAGAEEINLQRCYGRLIERCRLIEVESARSYIG